LRHLQVVRSLRLRKCIPHQQEHVEPHPGGAASSTQARPSGADDDKAAFSFMVHWNVPLPNAGNEPMTNPAGIFHVAAELLPEHPVLPFPADYEPGSASTRRDQRP
jgi:hypothetical protein